MMVMCSCATSYAQRIDPAPIYPYGSLVEYRLDVWKKQLYLQNREALEVCQAFYPKSEPQRNQCAFVYDLGQRYDFLVDLVKKYQAR